METAHTNVRLPSKDMARLHALAVLAVTNGYRATDGLLIRAALRVARPDRPETLEAIREAIASDGRKLPKTKMNRAAK